MAETLFRLGGIKLSGELVQIDLQEPDFSAERFTALLRKCTEAAITIPHLHLGGAAGSKQVSFCLGAEDFPRLQAEAADVLQDGKAGSIEAQGTITLYPHKFSSALFLQVIHVLSQENIPIRGISTSVSALVVHTDYSLLDRSAEAVLRVCELPENHTPLRPVVLLGDQPVETIAVYWEPKIRIYGMDLQKDLAHLRLRCSAEELKSIRRYRLAARDEKFRLIIGRRNSADDFCCELFVEKSRKETLRAELEAFVGEHQTAAISDAEDVEIISFHGPHFQDRYGIAERVFAALHGKISLVAAGCTGTSVQVVVAEAGGGQARECLEEICVVPS